MYSFICLLFLFGPVRYVLRPARSVKHTEGA